MARKKNGSFVGASMLDVDVDALTYKHTIANAIGDTARIFDRITGQNGHSAVDTINHDGTAGRGSLLGVPIAGQYIGRFLAVTSPSGGKDGSLGATWLVAVPVWIPPGESEFTVEIVGINLEGLRLKAYWKTSAWAQVGDQAEVTLDNRGRLGDEDSSWRASFTGLNAGATGLLRYLFVEGSTLSMGSRAFFRSWGLYRRRNSVAAAVAARRTSNLFGVTVPGAAEGLANLPFDAALFVNREAYHGYLTAYENRNQNALEEYITGWPCGGNKDYAHVDHDGAAAPDASDPARSRFMAHTRSLYANEPEIPFPLWCESFGAFKTDGGLVVDAVQPPTLGMLGWYAPWPDAGTPARTMRRLSMQYPDFQAAASRLKFACLVGSDAALITDWDASVVASTTVTAPFVALTGTPVASTLAVATGSALGFTGDQQAQLQLQLVKTRAVGPARAIKSIALLGWCLYYEP
jgi:hypothetical protein